MRSKGYSTLSVCLCVCMSVCVSVIQHLTFHAFIPATNDTNLLDEARAFTVDTVYDNMISGPFFFGSRKVQTECR